MYSDFLFFFGKRKLVIATLCRGSELNESTKRSSLENVEKKKKVLMFRFYSETKGITRLVLESIP